MGKIIGYVLKNIAILIGCLEALLKLAGGIVSLTPTKKDDKVVEFIDLWFGKIKKFFYDTSDGAAK